MNKIRKYYSYEIMKDSRVVYRSPRCYRTKMLCKRMAFYFARLLNCDPLDSSIYIALYHDTKKALGYE